MQSVNAMFIIHSYTAQQESWRHAWAAVKLKSANKNGFYFFFFSETYQQCGGSVWSWIQTRVIVLFTGE